MSTTPVTPAPDSAATPILHQRFRLRPSRSWAAVAPYIANIKFVFDPATSGTTGCKELWRQVRGQAIRRQFPKYTVDLEVVEDARPASVHVKFTNGVSLGIPGQGAGVLDLLDAMAETVSAIKEKEDMDALEKN